MAALSRYEEGLAAHLALQHGEVLADRGDVERFDAWTSVGWFGGPADHHRRHDGREGASRRHRRVFARSRPADLPLETTHRCVEADGGPYRLGATVPAWARTPGTGDGPASSTRRERRRAHAAEHEPALLDAARGCEAAGGVALAVPTDVGAEPEVQGLAQAALARFGRIDVWVNNAAVSAIGRFDEIPPDVFRQVIETTFFGYVYGARAALPIFRRQGGGTLIMLDSMASRAPHPFASPYLAAKGGIHAMSECIRMELLHDGEHGIHVCNVLPGVIDTPFYQHVANFSGREVKAMPPVYKPEEVAEAVVGLARTPRREVVVGVHAKAMVAQATLAPRIHERVTPPYVDRELFGDREMPPSTGNLFASQEPHTVDGGWDGKSSGAGLRKAALIGAAAGVAMLAWQRRS